VSGEALLRYLEAMRDSPADAWRGIFASITMVKPEATYLAWLDCRGAGLDDPFTFFLTRAMVAFNYDHVLQAGHRARAADPCHPCAGCSPKGSS
jgi:cysteine-S-conjugate beta-lyase